VASVPSDLPKGPQMQKNPAALPGNCVLPGSSYARGAKVDLENKMLEENGSSEELHSSKILSTVSPSCISGEEVQTSLSCLPLPVSICGSLVAMEEKVNPSPQNEMAEVISNISTVCAGKSHMDLSSMELIKNTDVHEEEWYMARINESIMEKSMDGEKDDTKHVIDDSDCQQIKDFTYTFLKYEAEPYDFSVESYCSESRSPGMTDFTVEESVIKSDSLISDAELDDFLYGQTLQSNVLKSSDNYSNLMEANANEGNVSNVNNLDFTEVGEEHLRAKLEDVMSIHSNLKVSSGASELESATKEDVSCIQNLRENGSEAIISDIHTEGARPKQLLGLSQGAVGQTQLNSRSDVLERKEEEDSSVTPDASLSGTIIDVGENSDSVLYGGGSSETVGSQVPENTESLKIPAVFSQKQPAWVPDSEAPKCMNCHIKFTFTKRRHHCRACGKV
ncbi:ZFY16 protein, partial [Alcedo cyanopectus]|nr:ZFY16 protein [Ceyx cyanopectus]